jgi:hypothetical protein
MSRLEARRRAQAVWRADRDRALEEASTPGRVCGTCGMWYPLGAEHKCLVGMVGFRPR